MVLMRIKEVTNRDLKKIVALEKEIFNQNAFKADLIGKLIKRNLFFLKLEVGKRRKKLIGFIIVIKDKEDRVNIINFLIKVKYQNRGYGSYLLQETIEKIKKVKEIQKIVLNVQEQNSIAIKLYQRFEFKKNPNVLKNYYQSGENAYLMELNIDSA
jgi:ribosomal protein S18 acetylase RimI-like enzyme